MLTVGAPGELIYAWVVLGTAVLVGTRLYPFTGVPFGVDRGRPEGTQPYALVNIARSAHLYNSLRTQ